MKPEQAEKDLYEIGKDRELIESYNKYWESITPTTDDEIIRRWIFAFLSVHTPWSGNVRSFLLLDKADRSVLEDYSKVKALIEESRAGCYEMKAKGIYEFNKAYIASQGYNFKLISKGAHMEERDLLMADCYGLGLAKTAFALEMCYPLRAQVACLDTHMLQLYGYTDKIERAKASSNRRKYHEMEKHWVDTCKEIKVAPTIARAIWWDKKQMQKDSRYWTYVLEK